MSGRHRVPVVWLMYVCVLAGNLLSGCASGPSRSFFARHAKVTAEDEYVQRLRDDAKRLDKKGHLAEATRLREQARAVAESSGSNGQKSSQTDDDIELDRSAAASKRRPLELPDNLPAVSERSLRSPKKDSAAFAKLELPPDFDGLSETERDSRAPQRGGGQFDVSSRGSLGNGFAPIEAPSPKRRSGDSINIVNANLPRPFPSPATARELTPTPTDNSTATALSTSGHSYPMPGNQLDEREQFPEPKTEIFTADFQRQTAQTEIVPAGMTRTISNDVTDPSNPWNQFRGLTKPVDGIPSRGGTSGLPMITPRQGRSSATGFDEPNVAATGRSPNLPNLAAWPTSNAPSFAPNDAGTASSKTGSVPPPWPANAANPFAQPGTAGASSSQSIPEQWPRAPGASGYGRQNDNPFAAPPNWNSAPSAGVSAPTANIQPVHAEQPPFAAAASHALGETGQSSMQSGFSFPPQTSGNSFAPQDPRNFPAAVAIPNGAPAAIAPFTSSPDLDRLIVQTTAETAAMIPGESEAERHAYLQKHVQLRLLYLISGQMERALQPVPGVDPSDQEFWQQMLWGVANYFDVQGMPDSAERATQTITQLQAAAGRLQEKARLELHNVAFCHKITSYGNYQRFKRDEFTPGQPVLLYAEVTNFKSEPTADGQFRTLMKSSIEVLDGTARTRVIDSIPFAPSEDRCRNHRRDYFHSYEFTIPPGINPGPHVLRLTVEDQLGKKSSVTTLNFTVQ